MKRILSLVLLLTLMLGCSNAFALNYTGRQGNEATFELLEEARANGPIAVQSLETNIGKIYVSHPVLDTYPLGKTCIYRSANLYGGRDSARQNTNIVVFAERAFESKDAALAYLQELGLTEIIDEAIGSVVLVTPSDSEKGFDAANQKNYYAQQRQRNSHDRLERHGIPAAWPLSGVRENLLELRKALFGKSRNR